MPKIIMIEPRWWYEFLLQVVALWKKYPRLANFYPIWADIFVFVYPIFLLILYFYWIIKKHLESKIAALFIFFWCFFSAATNILVQQFFDKQRPIYELWMKEFDETMLHQFLPTTSFPSDHAVVTFSIAMATFLIAHKNSNKKLRIWSYFLFLIAIITVLCRIWTTVHWTTDILAGCIMWILVPVILAIPSFYEKEEKWLFHPIIKFEERILEKLFKVKPTVTKDLMHNE